MHHSERHQISARGRTIGFCSVRRAVTCDNTAMARGNNATCMEWLTTCPTVVPIATHRASTSRLLEQLVTLASRYSAIIYELFICILPGFSPEDCGETLYESTWIHGTAQVLFKTNELIRTSKSTWQLNKLQAKQRYTVGAKYKKPTLPQVRNNVPNSKSCTSYHDKNHLLARAVPMNPLEYAGPTVHTESAGQVV